MQQIADATGLRKASLYHHFKSKEALFVEIMAVELDRVLLAVEEVRDFNGTIEEQLERVSLVNYEKFAQPDSPNLPESLLHVPESEHEEVHKRLREMEDYWQASLREPSQERAGADRSAYRRYDVLPHDDVVDARPEGLPFGDPATPR